MDFDTRRCRCSLGDADQPRPDVNTSSIDQHAYLSADAETLVFSSNRLGGSGLLDLWMTTREQVFPATKDECKNGGFERFGIFDNQGDYVSYVATNGSNQPR